MKSSTIFKRANLRPLASESCMKSIDQRSLGRVTAGRVSANVVDFAFAPRPHLKAICPIDPQKSVVTDRDALSL